MNRQTFNALIKLFAISVNRNPETDNTAIKERFKAFLYDYLEPKFIQSFFVLFENYLAEFSSKTSNKKLALNSVRLISFCEETALNLGETEKTIIIFNLIRLISETGSLNDSAEFVKLAGDIYGIKDDRLMSLLNYFNNNTSVTFYKLEFNGSIYAEYFEFSNGVYALKNLTDSDFYIDTVKITPGSICYALKESVIVFKDQSRVYFADYCNNLISKSDKAFSFILKDLSVSKSKTKILKEISIELNSGEFIGIIGNSGCGKTSFLSAVSGANKNYDGKIYLRTDDSNTNIQYSLLTQHNFFTPGFTVYEHLKKRCNYLQINKNEQSGIIDNIAQSVGLDNHFNKIVVKTNGDSQLSGGQMKRLAIAMELIHKPDVLILDEPTSGLSSEDSFQILSLIKGFASRNKLVISSIHQPDYDCLMLFDKILILDDNGYAVYFGHPLKAGSYMREITDSVDKDSVLEITHNTSVLLNLLKRRKENQTNEFYEKFRKSEMNYNRFSDTDVEIKPGNKTKLNAIKSFFSEFYLSIQLELKSASRISFILLIPFVCGLLLGVFSKYNHTGTYDLYFNSNIPVWLFMITITALFTGMLTSGNEFIRYRGVRLNEYYLKNKFISQNIAAFLKYALISFIQAVLLLLPSIGILDLSPFSKQIIIISFLLIYWGASLGILLSIMFRSSNVVFLILPVIIVLNMLFSGVIVKFDKFNQNIFGNKSTLTVRIAEAMPVYTAMNTLMLDIYLFNDKETDVWKDKMIWYESVYYCDYFVPELKDILRKDSVQAVKIIENEKNINAQFPSLNSKDVGGKLNEINEYYINYKTAAFNRVSDIYSNQNSDKNTYLNKELAAIVENYYDKPIIISEDKAIRQYMVPYLPPYYKCNNLIFNPYRHFSKYTMGTGHYNIFKLIFSILIIWIAGLLLKRYYSGR